MCMDNKIVQSFPVAEAGDCCHVDILDIYFEKVPQKPFQRTTSIFIHFQRSQMTQMLHGLTLMSMGKNMLQGMVQ